MARRGRPSKAQLEENTKLAEAKAAAAAEKEVKASSSNVDRDAQRELVDRLFEIETEFNAAKEERKERVQDFKVEVKSRYDSTGVDFKELQRLVKIRFEKEAAVQTMNQLQADLATWDILYGGSETEVDDLLN